jgi:molybdopterin molybdotransferase
MLSVADAQQIILKHVEPCGAEAIFLSEALGRVLAQAVTAEEDLPPFDNSGMDGYAVRASDVAQATRETPITLQVVADIAAGHPSAVVIGLGQAARIMTGAPVPPGATAVQPLEKTQPLDEFRVTISSAPAEGANVAPRGSEVRAGDVVLARGRVIDPAAIAVLASAGKARVRVARRPVVALLVTGDEIVGVAATPGAAQIRNSNGPAVAAQARLAGAEVRLLGVVPDRREEIAASLSEGLAADVLVVSGGVSAGDYDLVEPALLDLGATFLFTKVAIRPGAPLVFGRCGKTLVFGLPGNPVSAQVTFDLFVRPALLKMQGARVVSRPRVEVELLAFVRNRSGRRSHLPVRVRFEKGRLVARPVRSQGSGDLAAHARANALVVIDADRLQAAAGETAEAVLLGSFLEDDGAEP